MAREKEYLVIGPHKVLGHLTGQKFKASYVPALEAALVDAGHLRVLSTPPLRCDACGAHGNAAEKKKTFKNYGELGAHYTVEHPGLVAPAE